MSGSLATGPKQTIGERLRLRLLLAGLLAAVLPVPAAGGPFAACEVRFAAGPGGWKSCGCFYSVAIREGLYGEAMDRLAGHHRSRPELPCPPFYLGRLHLLLGEAEAAVPLLEEAAAGYGRRGPADGEVYARINLAAALPEGEAREELARAREVAERAQDLVLTAEVAVKEAELLLRHGGDLNRAEERLLWVLTHAYAAAHASLKRGIQQALGDLRYRVGRFEEAEAHFAAMAEVAAAAGDRFGEATARINRAAAMAAQLPVPGARTEAEILLREALAAAEASGNVEAAIEAHARLGDLLGGDRGRAHLRAALDLAGPHREAIPEAYARVLAASALDLVEEDPAAARRRMDEATDLLLASPDPWSQVYGWGDRLRVLWATGPREEALATSLRTLELAERLRETQGTTERQAEVAAVWTEIHLWLAGRLLLEAEETGDPEALDTAFAVAERMRARLLLQAVESSGLDAAGAVAEGRAGEWRELQRSIAGLNRRLLDSGLDAEERTRLLGRLRELERREGELLASGGRGAGPLLRRSAPTPRDEIAAGLAGDEALLAFQVGLWENLNGDHAGGAWLLSLTREGTRVHRLPGRDELEPAVGVLRGLFGHGDGSEAGPAASLYNRLLREALESLPPGIEKLILVPDGALHLLPFAALREAPEGPLLIDRYDLILAPSASLWHLWRSLEPSSGELAVALADPLSPAGEAAGAAHERAWTAGVSLGRLPRARREGRAAVRRLGEPARLLVGTEATERAVKRIAGEGLRLLHFGTHAVLDEAYPHRSAVVLAPGAADEDGLLRPREVAALPLDGAVVVLAACRSAQGTVLQGEGAFSLARAFLEGGARAVVGSLWPLEDAEAARVFDRFYHHLGRGDTVARALARAQRESRKAGTPAAAWAGLIVLGDGGAVVAPAGGSSRPPPLAAARCLGWGVAAVLLLSAVAVWTLRRRGSSLVTSGRDS